MTISKPLKSIIIGCGSIGALKPNKFDRPFGDDKILTHAHAYNVSPDISLCCVVDTDPKKAMEAAKKWSTNYETNIHEAMITYRPDIVSICSPTDIHFQILHEIIQYKPKLIIAEKPFCASVAQAKGARKLCKDANIPVAINYTRRYSLEYQFLRKKIVTGELGKIYHARLLYGRGLLRDGCHGLDLYNWFFGKVEGVLVNNSIYDHLPNDPSVTLYLKYERCSDAQLVAVDSRKYGVFEMDIVSEKGIHRLAGNGLWFYFYEPAMEKVYGEYKTLPEIPKDGKQSDLTNALSRLMANAAGYVLRKEELLCTVDDAVNVHNLINAINQVNILTQKEKERRGLCH